jgi:ferrochelatase
VAGPREVGPGAPLISKLRHYWAEEGFRRPMARNVAATSPAPGRGSSSPPTRSRRRWPQSSGPPDVPDAYETALREAAAGVVARLGGDWAWDLVFQSRSGPPQVPWLEPDVGDHLLALHAAGCARR